MLRLLNRGRITINSLNVETELVKYFKCSDQNGYVEEKIKIYSNLKNNIDKKYQYLFSFSIINDYLKR